jgi:hypothetical protein
MNKKQWIALGFLFFVCGLVAINITGETIQDVFVFLTWLCFITAGACIIFGLLEKG